MLVLFLLGLISVVVLGVLFLPAFVVGFPLFSISKLIDFHPGAYFFLLI